MATNLVEEIAAKVTALPVEQQRQALAFVESLAGHNPNPAEPEPFQSVRGILHGNLEHLEDDLEEVRSEMWRNFPREEPQ